MIRIVIWLVSITLAALGTIGLWSWIGLVPLLTGVFRVCPAYNLLGVNACKTA